MAGSELSREHLSDEALDELRLGGGSAAETFHLRTCPDCRTRAQALDELIGGIRAASLPGPEIPERVDAAVLWVARQQAQAGRRGTVIPQRRVVQWAALAASVLVMLFVPWLARRQVRDTAEQVSIAAADLDGSGEIDVRDAFLLAKAVQSNRADDTRWDLNGDGRIDNTDVELLGRRAVQIASAS